MNTNATPNKELNRKVFMNIITESAEVDNRSLFDRLVNQEELRAKLFSDDSEVFKNNPAYKIRSEQLLTNVKTLKQVRDDMSVGLLAGSIASEIVAEDGNINIHHFSKYNPIGEDFIVETQMLNVGRNNEAKTPVMMRGFGFMYLVDCESGRKLYLGVITIEKKKRDDRPDVKVYLEHPIFEEIIRQIDPTDIISFFIGNDFSGLRGSLLLHSSRYRFSLVSYKTNMEKGRKGRHRQVVSLIKSMSPNLIDFIRLTDLRKVMFNT